MKMEFSRGTLSRIIFDEIALEGLEGTTLPTLFVNLGVALKKPIHLNENIQEEIWNFIIKYAENKLEFYELPQARATLPAYNRFDYLDEVFGVPLAATECPFPRYKLAPVDIKLENGTNIMGSCEYFEERQLIELNVLRNFSLSNVLQTWNTRLVIVASQELRNNALCPINVPFPKDITNSQYCVLEAIGRSRHNGETTSGLYSLLHYCKDSQMLFYVKNRLLRYGVIAQQSFNEKRNDRLLVTTLLSLPRFFRTSKSLLVAVIEKLFITLKETEGYCMPMSETKNLFPVDDRPKKSFRKISLTHMFRKIFETRNVSITELPNPPTPLKNKDNKERTIPMIYLRDPNLLLEDIFSDEAKDDNKDEDENCGVFCNPKHSYVDMPLKEEFYRAIARHGASGISQTGLEIYLAQQRYTVRMLIKQALNDGIIKSYIKDMGRQRTTMYVVVENTENSQLTDSENKVDFEQIKMIQEPILPPTDEVKLSDIPSIIARVKHFDYQIKSVKSIDFSNVHSRYLDRRNQIINILNECNLIHSNDLRVQLLAHEKEKGYNTEMCIKSMKRILQALKQSNTLNIYEILLQFDDNIRLYRYVAHPQITIDHPLIQREIIKLKNLFFLNNEERKIRKKSASAREKSKSQLPNVKKKSLQDAFHKLNKTSKAAVHKPPKFLISRYLHEFLFYIVVELSEYQAPKEITVDLLFEWQRSEPSLSVMEYLDQISKQHTELFAYTEDISWRTFIPPLPKYSDKPAGWVFFIDVIDRMPLSIFNKIFRVEKEASPHLAEYITHPIRQHYLMRQLPPELQVQISRLQLHKVYLNILKLLNHMGLIQVTERVHIKEPLHMWIFFNRHTQILDTTTSEPGFSKINTDREYTAIKYEFSSFEDINQYWTNLQRICIYTKLGYRRPRDENEPERLKELRFVSTVTFDEAPSHDNGQVPGDHLGAAGFSRTLFAHSFRNWSWLFHGGTKPKSSRTANSRISKITYPTNKATRKRQRRAGNVVAAIKKVPLQSTSGVVKSVVRVRKSGPRDAIDRDALKNMRTLRTKWCSEEDNILKIARAVYVYMAAPVTVLGLLTVGKICRDIIRHHLGITNKTSQACCRRLQFLIKNKRHVPQVPNWLHLLQSNAQIQKRFGDTYLDRLKQCFKNRSEFSNALTLHFIEIFIFLYKHINKLNENVRNHQFIIPNSLPEFQKLFYERKDYNGEADEDSVCNFNENPRSDIQVDVALLYNVLHSSLCCVRDKSLYTMQAFDIYKNYSEETLHTTFQKARTDNLVVALKRKSMQLLRSQYAGPTYLLSSRYKLRLRFLSIPYIVYDTFYAYFEKCLPCLFGENRKYLELKSPQLGQLFFIAEGLTRNFWACNIKLPSNILTIDAEQQRQSESSMDKILDHYHSIFENAPHTEYAKNLENFAENSEKQIRVKFQPANLCYKIQYSPYDIISKLPNRYLHFFCALDHLHRDVEIDFSKLHQHDKAEDCLVIVCPFNCILKSDNYINAIERIVQEKSSVLKNLSEMPAQKLLNMATSDCAMTVLPTNLLTLVRMLETFWHDKEQFIEKKDIGKLATNINQNKTIDWHQLCLDIIDYDTNTEDEIERIDEYEPTLNKEERIRAQDVFVVNLPTLNFTLSTQLTNCTDLVLYKGYKVPKQLVENELRRDAILQKVLSDAFWNYNENSLDTLYNLHNTTDWSNLAEVHNFIENKKYGVSVTDLMHKFPYPSFLSNALKILSDHGLIKRVGVASFVYVHKSHIRPWLVHSFHIKRLEKENMASKSSLKRKAEDVILDITNEDDDQPSSSKKAKENNGEMIKRVSKPVERFEAGTDNSDVNLNAEGVRDVIVMKPYPWMRLNGSLNRRVLDRWLGSLLTECIHASGCMLLSICSKFHHMKRVDIMFLLEILIDIKCIKLTQMKSEEVDLFASYEDIVEEEVQNSLYDPEFTYVTAMPDAVMRFAMFVGNKKYNSEFI